MRVESNRRVICYKLEQRKNIIMKNLKIKTVIADPDEILNADESIKKHYFEEWGNHKAEYLSVIFSKGTLYFATGITEKEATMYKNILIAYAKAPDRQRAGEQGRFYQLLNRFGPDGIDTANEMFDYFRVEA